MTDEFDEHGYPIHSPAPGEDQDFDQWGYPIHQGGNNGEE